MLTPTRVRKAIKTRAGDLRLTPVSRRVRRERLTYLIPEKLRVLEQAAEMVRTRGVPGSVLECGIALGGSGIALATLLDDRPFDGYDVFGMIPPPSEKDPPEVHERYATITSGASRGIGGDAYYGYRTDLLKEVEASFARFGAPLSERVRLHSGLFEDTLHPAEPVALAHIDCDWHDPVALCIERIWPQLSVGGLLIFDDYNDYGGCRTAVDAFIAANADAEMVRTSPNATVVRRPQA